MNKHHSFFRWFFYLLGLLILAIGLILNSKTSFGVSPMISIAYCFSEITGVTFGNTTFIQYLAFVIIEIVIHIIRKKYTAIPKDLLQIILSLVFTRFMNIFSSLIPNLESDLGDTIWGSFPSRILFLLLAIVLTGVGAALSLNARLVPNPGDGIVQTISDFTGKTIGFTKNCMDISCVIISTTIGVLVLGHLSGSGLGTILAMLGVGRVIAVFNHFTMIPIRRLSGLEQASAAE